MAIKDEVNEAAIKELQRLYDEVCKDYNEASVKILAYLGGALGFLAYLYSGGNLFIPHQTYGKIFYAASLAAVLGSIGYLLFALRANEWTVPIDRKVIKKLDDSYSKSKFLEHTKEMYNEALDEDLQIHNRKQKALNMVTLPLVIGAIMLLVIRYFGR